MAGRGDGRRWGSSHHHRSAQGAGAVARGIEDAQRTSAAADALLRVAYSGESRSSSARLASTAPVGGQGYGQEHGDGWRSARFPPGKTRGGGAGRGPRAGGHPNAKARQPTLRKRVFAPDPSDVPAPDSHLRDSASALGSEVLGIAESGLDSPPPTGADGGLADALDVWRVWHGASSEEGQEVGPEGIAAFLAEITATMANVRAADAYGTGGGGGAGDAKRLFSSPVVYVEYLLTRALGVVNARAEDGPAPVPPPAPPTLDEVVAGGGGAELLRPRQQGAEGAPQPPSAPARATSMHSASMMTAGTRPTSASSGRSAQSSVRTARLRVASTVRAAATSSLHPSEGGETKAPAPPVEGAFPPPHRSKRSRRHSRGRGEAQHAQHAAQTLDNARPGEHFNLGMLTVACLHAMQVLLTHPATTRQLQGEWGEGSAASPRGGAGAKGRLPSHSGVQANFRTGCGSVLSTALRVLRLLAASVLRPRKDEHATSAGGYVGPEGAVRHAAADAFAEGKQAAAESKGDDSLALHRAAQAAAALPLEDPVHLYTSSIVYADAWAASQRRIQHLEAELEAQRARAEAAEAAVATGRRRRAGRMWRLAARAALLAEQRRKAHFFNTIAPTRGAFHTFLRLPAERQQHFLLELTAAAHGGVRATTQLKCMLLMDSKQRQWMFRGLAAWLRGGDAAFTVALYTQHKLFRRAAALGRQTAQPSAGASKAKERKLGTDEMEVLARSTASLASAGSGLQGAATTSGGASLAAVNTIASSAVYAMDGGGIADAAEAAEGVVGTSGRLGAALSAGGRAALPDRDVMANVKVLLRSADTMGVQRLQVVMGAQDTPAKVRQGEEAPPLVNFGRVQNALVRGEGEFGTLASHWEQVEEQREVDQEAAAAAKEARKERKRARLVAAKQLKRRQRQRVKVAVVAENGGRLPEDWSSGSSGSISSVSTPGPGEDSDDGQWMVRTGGGTAVVSDVWQGGETDGKAAGKPGLAAAALGMVGSRTAGALGVRRVHVGADVQGRSEAEREANLREAGRVAQSKAATAAAAAGPHVPFVAQGMLMVPEARPLLAEARRVAGYDALLRRLGDVLDEEEALKLAADADADDADVDEANARHLLAHADGFKFSRKGGFSRRHMGPPPAGGGGQSMPTPAVTALKAHAQNIRQHSETTSKFAAELAELPADSARARALKEVRAREYVRSLKKRTAAKRGNAAGGDLESTDSEGSTGGAKGAIGWSDKTPREQLLAVYRGRRGGRHRYAVGKRRAMAQWDSSDTDSSQGAPPSDSDSPGGGSDSSDTVWSHGPSGTRMRRRRRRRGRRLAAKPLAGFLANQMVVRDVTSLATDARMMRAEIEDLQARNAGLQSRVNRMRWQLASQRVRRDAVISMAVARARRESDAAYMQATSLAALRPAGWDWAVTPSRLLTMGVPASPGTGVAVSPSTRQLAKGGDTGVAVTGTGQGPGPAPGGTSVTLGVSPLEALLGGAAASPSPPALPTGLGNADLASCLRVLLPTWSAGTVDHAVALQGLVSGGGAAAGNAAWSGLFSPAQQLDNPLVTPQLQQAFAGSGSGAGHGPMPRVRALDVAGHAPITAGAPPEAVHRQHMFRSLKAVFHVVNMALGMVVRGGRAGAAGARSVGGAAESAPRAGETNAATVSLHAKQVAQMPVAMLLAAHPRLLALLQGTLKALSAREAAEGAGGGGRAAAVSGPDVGVGGSSMQGGMLLSSPATAAALLSAYSTAHPPQVQLQVRVAEAGQLGGDTPSTCRGYMAEHLATVSPAGGVNLGAVRDVARLLTHASCSAMFAPETTGVSGVGMVMAGVGGAEAGMPLPSPRDSVSSVHVLGRGPAGAAPPRVMLPGGLLPPPSTVAPAAGLGAHSTWSAEHATMALTAPGQAQDGVNEAAVHRARQDGVLEALASQLDMAGISMPAGVRAATKSGGGGALTTSLRLALSSRPDACLDTLLRLLPAGEAWATLAAAPSGVATWPLLRGVGSTLGARHATHALVAATSAGSRKAARAASKGAGLYASGISAAAPPPRAHARGGGSTTRLAHVASMASDLMGPLVDPALQSWTPRRPCHVLPPGGIALPGSDAADVALAHAAAQSQGDDGDAKPSLTQAQASGAGSVLPSVGGAGSDLAWSPALLAIAGVSAWDAAVLGPSLVQDLLLARLAPVLGAWRAQVAAGVASAVGAVGEWVSPDLHFDVRGGGKRGADKGSVLPTPGVTVMTVAPPLGPPGSRSGHRGKAAPASGGGSSSAAVGAAPLEGYSPATAALMRQLPAAALLGKAFMEYPLGHPCHPLASAPDTYAPLATVMLKAGAKWTYALVSGGPVGQRPPGHPRSLLPAYWGVARSLASWMVTGDHVTTAGLHLTQAEAGAGSGAAAVASLPGGAVPLPRGGRVPPVPVQTLPLSLLPVQPPAVGPLVARNIPSSLGRLFLHRSDAGSTLPLLTQGKAGSALVRSLLAMGAPASSVLAHLPGLEESGASGEAQTTPKDVPAAGPGFSFSTFATQILPPSHAAKASGGGGAAATSKSPRPSAKGKPSEAQGGSGRRGKGYGVATQPQALQSMGEAVAVPPDTTAAAPLPLLEPALHPPLPPAAPMGASALAMTITSTLPLTLAQQTFSLETGASARQGGGVGGGLAEAARSAEAAMRMTGAAASPASRRGGSSPGRPGSHFSLERGSPSPHMLEGGAPRLAPKQGLKGQAAHTASSTVIQQLSEDSEGGKAAPTTPPLAAHDPPPPEAGGDLEGSAFALDMPWTAHADSMAGSQAAGSVAAPLVLDTSSRAGSRAGSETGSSTRPTSRLRLAARALAKQGRAVSPVSRSVSRSSTPSSRPGSARAGRSAGPGRARGVEEACADSPLYVGYARAPPLLASLLRSSPALGLAADLMSRTATSLAMHRLQRASALAAGDATVLPPGWDVGAVAAAAARAGVAAQYGPTLWGAKGGHALAHGSSGAGGGSLTTLARAPPSVSAEAVRGLGVGVAPPPPPLQPFHDAGVFLSSPRPSAQVTPDGRPHAGVAGSALGSWASHGTPAKHGSLAWSAAHSRPGVEDGGSLTPRPAPEAAMGALLGQRSLWMGASGAPGSKGSLAGATLLPPLLRGASEAALALPLGLLRPSPLAGMLAHDGHAVASAICRAFASSSAVLVRSSILWAALARAEAEAKQTENREAARVEDSIVGRTRGGVAGAVALRRGTAPAAPSAGPAPPPPGATFGTPLGDIAGAARAHIRAVLGNTRDITGRSPLHLALESGGSAVAVGGHDTYGEADGYSLGGGGMRQRAVALGEAEAQEGVDAALPAGARALCRLELPLPGVRGVALGSVAPVDNPVEAASVGVLHEPAPTPVGGEVPASSTGGGAAPTSSGQAPAAPTAPQQQQQPEDPSVRKGGEVHQKAVPRHTPGVTLPRVSALALHGILGRFYEWLVRYMPLSGDDIAPSELRVSVAVRPESILHSLNVDRWPGVVLARSAPVPTPATTTVPGRQSSSRGGGSPSKREGTPTGPQPREGDAHATRHGVHHSASGLDAPPPGRPSGGRGTGAPWEPSAAPGVLAPPPHATLMYTDSVLSYWLRVFYRKYIANSVRQVSVVMGGRFVVVREGDIDVQLARARERARERLRRRGGTSTLPEEGDEGGEGGLGSVGRDSASGSTSPSRRRGRVPDEPLLVTPAELEEVWMSEVRNAVVHFAPTSARARMFGLLSGWTENWWDGSHPAMGLPTATAGTAASAVLAHLSAADGGSREWQSPLVPTASSRSMASSGGASDTSGGGIARAGRSRRRRRLSPRGASGPTGPEGGPIPPGASSVPHTPLRVQVEAVNLYLYLMTTALTLRSGGGGRHGTSRAAPASATAPPTASAPHMGTHASPHTDTSVTVARAPLGAGHVSGASLHWRLLVPRQAWGAWAGDGGGSAPPPPLRAGGFVQGRGDRLSHLPGYAAFPRWVSLGQLLRFANAPHLSPTHTTAEYARLMVLAAQGAAMAAQRRRAQAQASGEESGVVVDEFGNVVQREAPGASHLPSGGVSLTSARPSATKRHRLQDHDAALAAAQSYLAGAEAEGVEGGLRGGTPEWAGEGDEGEGGAPPPALSAHTSLLQVRVPTTPSLLLPPAHTAAMQTVQGTVQAAAWLELSTSGAAASRDRHNAAVAAMSDSPASEAEEAEEGDGGAAAAEGGGSDGGKPPKSKRGKVGPLLTPPPLSLSLAGMPLGHPLHIAGVPAGVAPMAVLPGAEALGATRRLTLPCRSFPREDAEGAPLLPSAGGSSGGAVPLAHPATDAYAAVLWSFDGAVGIGEGEAVRTAGRAVAGSAEARDAGWWSTTPDGSLPPRALWSQEALPTVAAVTVLPWSRITRMLREVLPPCIRLPDDWVGAGASLFDLQPRPEEEAAGSGSLSPRAASRSPRGAATLKNIVSTITAMSKGRRGRGHARAQSVGRTFSGLSGSTSPQHSRAASMPRGRLASMSDVGGEDGGDASTARGRGSSDGGQALGLLSPSGASLTGASTQWVPASMTGLEQLFMGSAKVALAEGVNVTHFMSAGDVLLARAFVQGYTHWAWYRAALVEQSHADNDRVRAAVMADMQLGNSRGQGPGTAQASSPRPAPSPGSKTPASGDEAQARAGVSLEGASALGPLHSPTAIALGIRDSGLASAAFSFWTPALAARAQVLLESEVLPRFRQAALGGSAGDMLGGGVLGAMMGGADPAAASRAAAHSSAWVLSSAARAAGADAPRGTGGLPSGAGTDGVEEDGTMAGGLDVDTFLEMAMHAWWFLRCATYGAAGLSADVAPVDITAAGREEYPGSHATGL